MKLFFLSALLLLLDLSVFAQKFRKPQNYTLTFAEDGTLAKNPKLPSLLLMGELSHKLF